MTGAGWKIQKKKRSCRSEWSQKKNGKMIEKLKQQRVNIDCILSFIPCIPIKILSYHCSRPFTKKKTQTRNQPRKASPSNGEILVTLWFIQVRFWNPLKSIEIPRKMGDLPAMFDTGYPSVRTKRSHVALRPPSRGRFTTLSPSRRPGFQRVDDKPWNLGEIPPKFLDQMAINGVWQSWIIWTPDMGVPTLN